MRRRCRASAPSDGFASMDLRVSRPFSWGKARLEPIVEVFNLFNVTNVLGVSVKNYSGYANVLVRDSQNPDEAGYLRSSSFGTAVNTAGGVFGQGRFECGIGEFVDPQRAHERMLTDAGDCVLHAGDDSGLWPSEQLVAAEHHDGDPGLDAVRYGRFITQGVDR